MAAVKNIEKVRFNSRKLSEEQVRLVLTATDMTNPQIAELVGVSKDAIQKIRAGHTYAEMLPELERPNKGAPRSTGPRCTSCVHYFRGTCTMGFPEVRERGIYAASQCSAYATQRLELSYATT